MMKIYKKQRGEVLTASEENYRSFFGVPAGEKRSVNTCDYASVLSTNQRRATLTALMTGCMYIGRKEFQSDISMSVLC